MALCPCCKRVDKTNVHLLSCTTTANFREMLLTELDEVQLKQFMISGIRSWMDDPDQGIKPFHVSMEFLPIATKQNSIGWYSTLLG